MQPLLLAAVDPAVRMALTQKVVENICMEPLSNFVSHSPLTINDFPAFVNSQLAKDFSCPKTEFPSVYKGPNGQNGWMIAFPHKRDCPISPMSGISIHSRF